MSDNIILSINQVDPPVIEIVQSAPSNISILKSFASINDIPNFYESVDDRVSGLLVAGSGVILDYNDNLNSLTISIDGFSSSGIYLEPTVANIIAGGGIGVSSSSGVFTIRSSGLNSSYITDFSSSVSGLLPVKSVAQGSGINVSSSSGIFTVSATQNDHGSLYGLADDDHLQYAHIDNARTINAVHNFSNGLGINIASPSGALHIINDNIACYIGDYGNTHYFDGYDFGGKVRVFADDDDIQVQGIKTVISKVGIPSGAYIGINGTSYTIGGGGSGTNVGLYGYAGNGLKNWGLWIDNGQSIFDDSVGIKTQNPNYTLDVMGSGNFSNSLYVSGVAVSVSGHPHFSSDISNFSSSVSGLLPITSIIAGSGIDITPSGTIFSISSTGASIIPSGSISYSQISNSVTESINIAKRTSKAWVNFNGTGTISIRDSFNVSSITDNGTGDYTINFITPFTNTDYCFVTWSRDWNGDTYVVNSLGAKSLTTKTTSSLRLINNFITNGFNYDSSECNIIMFGN